MFHEHFVCFTCRKSFRRAPARSHRQPTPYGLLRPDIVCPACGKPSYQMGSKFKAPKRTDLHAWKELASYYVKDMDTE